MNKIENLQVFENYPFLSTLPDNKYMEISYAMFLNKPLATIRRVLAFIEISNDPSVKEFTGKNISRRTKNLDNRSLTDLESRLGGKLLPIPLDSTSGGLTSEYIRIK